MCARYVKQTRSKVNPTPTNQTTTFTCPTNLPNKLATHCIFSIIAYCMKIASIHLLLVATTIYQWKSVLTRAA